MSVNRIDADTARERVRAGDALLVCAYDNQEKFLANQLEGAISLDQLRQQESSLDKNRQLIFY